MGDTVDLFSATDGIRVTTDGALSDIDDSVISVNDGLTVTGVITGNSDLTIDGNTTLGNASGDTLTINGTAVSIPNSLNFDTNTLFVDAGNNRVGIGNINPLESLDVTGNATVSGNLTLSGGLRNIQGTANQSITLGGNTTGNIILSPNGGSGLVDFSTATTRLNGLTYTWPSSGQSSGYALLTNGSGTLSWGAVATGTNFWTSQNGSLYPINQTLDLFVGGSSTISSKFAFVNTTTGTPTASISANSGDNNTFLTGLGVLGTTNAQSLTLGSSTTGNVNINPGSGLATIANLSTDASGLYFGTNGTTRGLFDITGGNVATYSALTSFTQTSAFTGLTMDLRTGFTVPNTSTGNQTGIKLSLTDGGAGATAIGIDLGGTFDRGIDLSNTLTVNDVAVLLPSTNATTGGIRFGSDGNSVNLYRSANDVLATDDTFTIGDELRLSDSDASNYTGFVSPATLGSNLIYTLPNGGVSAGYALVTDASGVLSWTNPTGLGTNHWALSNGILYPYNNTLDLIIGGSSTASARFAVLNIAGGNPTASVSGSTGGMYFTSTGDLTTTNKQSISIGGINSGEIFIDAGGDFVTVQDDTTINGALTVTGAITAPIDTNTINDLVIDVGGIITNGTWNATAIDPAYGGTGDDTSGLSGVAYVDNGDWNYESALASGRGGTGFSTYATGDLIYAVTTDTLSKLAIGTAGQVLAVTAGLPAWTDSGVINYWQRTSGAIAPAQITNDLLLGGVTTASARFAFINSVGSNTPTASISAQNAAAQALTISANGYIQTTSRQALTLGGGNTGNVVIAPNGEAQDFVEFASDGTNLSLLTSDSANLTVNPSGSLTLNSVGDLTVDSTTDIVFDADGADVILRDGGAEYARFTNSTTDLTLDIAGGNLIFANNDVLNVGGGTAAVFNFFANDSANGDGNIMNSDADLYVEGDFEVDGQVRLNNRTYTFPATETSGYVLSTDGAGVLSWIQVVTGANFWKEVAGSLIPINQTYDLLVGGSGTSNAKFAVLNISGTNTPVASISAKTGAAAGTGLTFNADGTVQSLLNGTLTLGGDTTGNIVLNSGSGQISVFDTIDMTNQLITNIGDVGTDFTSGGGLTLAGAGDFNGQLDLGDGADSIALSGTTISLTSNTAGNDISLTSADDIIFDDSTLTSPIPLTIAATTLSTPSQAIIDAINEAWNAATGGGGGGSVWSISGNVIYPSSLGNQVGIGTTTAGDVVNSFYVTRSQASGALGKSLAIFNQTEDQNIIAASSSGSTVFTVGNTGTITSEGNIVLQESGGGGDYATLDVAVLGGAKTYVFPDYTGSTADVCLTTGNCTGGAGGLGGSGTIGFVPKFTASSTVGNSIIYDDTYQVGVGTTTPLGKFDVRGTSGTAPVATFSANTSGAAFVIDNYGNGPIFTASNSGTTQFVIASNGFVGIGRRTPIVALDINGSASVAGNLKLDGANSIGTTDRQTLTLGDSTTGNIVVDAGTGGISLLDNVTIGGSSTFTTGTGLTTINGDLTIAGTTLSLTGAATLDLINSQAQALNVEGGLLNFDTLNSRIGIGTTTPTATLDIVGSASISGNLTFAAGIRNIQAASNQALTLGGNTTGTIFISPNNGTGLVDFSTAKTRLNGQTYTWPADAGTNLYSLITDGNGTLSWANTATGINWFAETEGVIYPINETVDFVLGGTSTASANFSIINMNSGVPIASMSAGAPAGAMYFTSTGNLATTNSQSLSLGGSETGDVVFTTQAGPVMTIKKSGRVGIGTTDPGSFLEISNTETTANAVTVTANSLTSGTGLYLSSTSTGLTTGALMTTDWSPASTTVATGDLFTINIGPNGSANSLFAVKDNGFSVFNVTENFVTSALPVSFASSGDVSVAYDLAFTNPIGSFISSSSPLTVRAGERFGSSNLTLKTYNDGRVYVDSRALVTNGSIGINTVTPYFELHIASTSSNFGGYAFGGAFASHNSYFGEEFIDDVAQVAATGAQNWGDNSQWTTLETGACTWDSIDDEPGGAMRVQATSTADYCDATLTASGSTADGQTIFDADNLPFAVMKVRPSVNSTGVPDTDHQFHVGFGTFDSTPQSGFPTDGIFFSNSSDSGGTTGTANWYAVTRSSSTTTQTACNVAISETQYALLAIKVLSNSIVEFYIDGNVSNGIQLQKCATHTTNIPKSVQVPLVKADYDAGSNASILDVDFYRVWQDDEPGQSGGTVQNASYNPETEADVAETYMTLDGTDIEAGSIVSADVNSRALVKASQSQYEKSLVGVVSTSPKWKSLLGQGGEGTVMVGVTGRVPVKISDENGNIEVGDYITSSSTPGVGMKATKAGPVIGKALESWNTGGSSTVLIQIQAFSYSPSYTFNSTGELSLEPDSNALDGSYVLFDGTGKMVDNQEAFDTVAAANIFTGKLNAEDIFTTNLEGQTATFSSTLSSQKVNTDIVGHEDGHSVDFRNNEFAVNWNNLPQFTISQEGAATFSGSLAAQSINATIGTIETLTVKNLIVDSIEGFTASSSAVFNLGQEVQSDYATFDFATISNDLLVLGPATLQEASVNTTITVNSDLTIGSNYINTLTDELAIQPLGQQAVSIMNGKVRIETDGTLVVKEDAIFEKNVTVQGNITTGVIKGINDSVAISGSAQFEKINVKYNPALIISDTEVTATSSAGIVTLVAGESEIQVNNPLVKSDSLIFITPKTDTQGSTLYIKEQVAGDHFTVGIDYTTLDPIEFNFLIFNNSQ